MLTLLEVSLGNLLHLVEALAELGSLIGVGQVAVLLMVSIVGHLVRLNLVDGGEPLGKIRILTGRLRLTGQHMVVSQVEVAGNRVDG